MVVAKGLPAAESVACEAKATSDAHHMCAAMFPCIKRPRCGAVWPVQTSASDAKPAETSSSAAQPVEPAETSAEPSEPSGPLADYGDSDYEVVTDDSEPEPDAGGGAEKPAVHSFPLANAMFKAFGGKLGAGDAERKLFGQVGKSCGREAGSTLSLVAA